MIRNWLVLTIMCALCLGGCHKSDKTAVKSIDGQKIGLQQLRGKWVFVNYWATWCQGCLNDIAALKKFAAQNGNSVVVLGVNYDQLANPELKAAATRWSITYPVLVKDPQRLWGLPDVDLVPTTFVINPQGKVVKTILGTETTASFNRTLSDLEATYKIG